MKYILVILGVVGIIIVIIGGGFILSNIISRFVKEQNKDGTRLVVFILWIVTVSYTHLTLPTTPYV